MSLARDIMDALGDALRGNLPKCKQVVARMNLEPNEPCIDIYPDVVSMEERDERGFGDHNSGALRFTVRARVGVVNYDTGQDILIDWMDPTNAYGVAALLEGDQTLNGLATSVDVDPVSGFTQFVDINGKTSRIGATWGVRVMPAES